MTATLYFFFYGLSHTSATFGCAFVNMTPVLTFLLSLPFGMESLNIRSKAGLAKVLGTALCAGGAMVLTLYKGRVLTPPTSGSLRHASQKIAADDSRKQWILGSLSLVAGSVSWASWFVIQATISKAYPALYSNNAIVTLLSALQSVAFTFVFHRDPSIWALRGTLQVVTVVYGGAVSSCLAYILMGWCVKKRGPVFTAAFTPLIQVSVAIIEVLFLHGQLHLGSVLGSVVIITGLYMLLCGKSKENKCLTEKQRQAVDDSPALQLA
ncbi:unnamed protein product [Victoria cruziana]